MDLIYVMLPAGWSLRRLDFRLSTPFTSLVTRVGRRPVTGRATLIAFGE